jgi:beta-ribofuranosylaminobenzene 5'-phosphate synthase
MESVTVITPSRVHLALIDLNGGLGRVDGGIGLSLERPGFRITAQNDDETQICGPDESVRRAGEILELLRENCSIGHVRIEIEENIPAHVGLGSGTQLSLGIAQAISRLYGMGLSPREMAFLVGRGGTSGIGVAAFSQGGFIVDGGHSFSTKASSRTGMPVIPGQKTCFLPSSASSGVEPPPVIARYDFPDWEILIAIPHCRRISGPEEVDLFQTLCPLPLSDIQALSHIILMKLLPAIVQRDLEPFGEAVDLIQNMAWKEVEIEKQDPVVRMTMNFLWDNGAHGVGLSSWGPAIFCFGHDLKPLEAKTRGFLASTEAEGICFLTRANNTGAVVIEGRNGVYGGRSEAANLQRTVHR